MAVLALAAVGSAVGSSLAAGTALAAYGSTIGWAVGSLVGQALFPTKIPDQKIQGPRFTDTAIQSSSYGQMLPILYGTLKVAGNVIWASEVREVATSTSQEVGGKSGGSSQTVTQTNYSYFVDVAIALCEGEATGIRRGWVNKELKYDVGTAATSSTVAASALGATALRFYPGSETQTIDPTIEAAEGTDAPAYRGVCYVVLEGLNVTPYGGRMPSIIEFEVVKSGSVAATLDISDGVTVGTTATLSTSLTPVIGTNGNVWYLGAVSNTAVLVNYFTQATVATYTRDTWGYRPIALSLDGNSAVYNNAGGTFGFLNADGSVTEYNGAYASMGSGGSLFGVAWLDSRRGYAQGDSSSSTTFFYFHLDDEDQSVYEVILSSARSTHLFTNACAIDGRCYVYGSSTYSNEVGYISTADNNKITLFSGNTYASHGLLVSRDGYLWMARSGASTDIEKRDSNGTLVDSVTLPGSVAASKLLEAPDGMIMAYSGSNACYLIHPTTLTVEQTSENPGTKNPLGFLSDGRMILSSTSGSDFLLHEMERLPRVTTSTVTLASVVSDLCDRVGLTSGDIDVSELTDSVRGYVLGRRDSARSVIEPLRTAYRFDAVESDGQIAFRKRGRAVSVVIAEDDLAARPYGEDPPPKVSAERSLETESPREVAVQHIDPGLDYEIGSQYARRLTGSSDQVSNIELPVVLTAAEAAGLAEFALYDAWISRNTQTIRVSRKHAAIEPSDVIQFAADGITRTSRVLDATYEGGVSTLELVDDDADITDTAAGGVSGPTPSSTISAIGPTVMRLLDIPLLRDADDGAGFYAASTGLYSGWQGAELWMSRDAGVTWEPTTTSFLSASVIGTAVTALATFSGGNVFDEINTVEVLLINGTLSSVTEEQVRSGSNACYLGGELMSFKSAELVSTGRYRLSGLRRGRKGTEQYMTTHAVGDAFVLLDTSVKRVALTTTDIGASLQFKAVTFGQLVAEAAAVPFTPAAVGLECYSPVHITAGRSAASAPYDITITWKRRNRLDAEWRSYADVPQSETSESYELDIYTNSSFSTVKRSITGLSSATTTYTSANQVSDFGSNQTTLYLKVYQLSSVTGRGFAGTATVTV